MVNFPFGEAQRRSREASSENHTSPKSAVHSASGAAPQSASRAAQITSSQSETSDLAWRLLEKSGQITMLAAPDGKLHFANRAAHLAFGYEWDENKPTLWGQNWLSWVHPADVSHIEETLQRLQRQIEVYVHFEVRLRYSGGQAKIVDNAAWHWFDITVTNFLDDQKAGWLVQAKDISARRDSEEKLCHAVLQFNETQRLASLGYWEWDVETNRVQWSEELFHIFGLRPGESELTLSRIEACVHPDDRSSWRFAIERAVRDRKMLDYHYRIQRPSGAIRTIHAKARVVIGAGDRVTHLSGIAQDITEHLESEQDLRHSEARFRRIADSNIIGIMSWDANGLITEANDAFLRIVGYTRSDLWEGDVHPDALTPPEFRAADAHAFHELAERGACTPYEKEYLRKDGTRVPVLVGAAYLEPGSGDDLGICFVLDRTGAQAAEAALRDSENRYRQLVETSPDAIFVHSKGQILFANNAAASLLGARSASELVGRRALDLIAPPHRETVEARLERLHRGEPQEMALEMQILRLDGDSLEVEVSSNVMRYQGVPAIQSVLRDISQRQNNERELRRNEEQLRLLIENIPEALTILDKNGDLLYYSPSVEEITGYPRGELLGDLGLEKVHPDDHESVRHFLKTILQDKGNEAHSVEIRLRHRDGSWRVLETIGKTLPPGAPYQGVLLTTRDTTRRRDIENRLREVSSELEAIYAAFPDVYLRLHADGLILAYHSAENVKFPVSSERLFGKRLPELLPQPAAAVVSGALAEVERTRQPIRVEFELPLHQSTRRYEMRLQPLLHEQTIAIVRDLTVETAEIGTFLESPSIFIESPAKTNATDINAALSAQQQNIEKLAQQRGLALEFNDSGPLEVALESSILNEALDTILKSALACASTACAVHIGYEARFEEVPLAQSVRLRSRACLHVIGQGNTDEIKPQIKRLRETLMPYDADAGVESAGSSFVFWLDLPAIRFG